ncbi:MAG: calcium/proton exchanger [Anaerolineae bacterium]|nr:calcium/proton exchanger [Anaerolineae bacterium]NIN96850.1 calcium/proton exchanger [Anaerolineae bacterium]NIQ79829.1 calcium/proton exchanger [Anaerolineae bacterium]
MRYISTLLIFVPISIFASLLGWDQRVVFLSSALGIVPLAWILGKATEELAAHTGPRVGGLLNATLGNAAELIIAIFAIREGLLDLVKASITGSILGNILLVLGLSVLLGGLRNGVQHFDRSEAGLNATSMTLAVIALLIPSIFGLRIPAEIREAAVEWLSLGVAVVMIVIYVLSVSYSFLVGGRGTMADEHAVTNWSVRRAVLILLLATVFVAWLSEILVSAVGPVVETLGITEFFLGVIIIPLVGNVAEHLVAVQAAWKNEMDLSLAISVGSSMQIALFVAPVLVFISLAMGNPLTLIFNEFELLALAAAVFIAAFISLDGESNWLEGAQLLAVYLILVLAFFLPVPMIP